MSWTISKRKKPTIRDSFVGGATEFRKKIGSANILIQVPKNGYKEYSHYQGRYTDNKIADIKISVNDSILMTWAQLREFVEDLKDIENEVS